jgi:hypothetical protein
LGSCTLPYISPALRAYNVVAGVNAVSRDVLAENFLPTITQMPDLVNPAVYPVFWEGLFPYASGPYSLTVMDASNPAAVTLTLQDNQAGAPLDILLVMSKIGNDWFIQRMEMPPGAPIVQ